eukprot:Phypoly_transcript_06125.p1 GENE.Phypoly_transcript_06125~~Phypoly_transcript_06125.p1  ORF type:complete len:607 (-),score=92.63 Phypoly_transcript_06125:21-1841(-)
MMETKETKETIQDIINSIRKNVETSSSQLGLESKTNIGKMMETKETKETIQDIINSIRKNVETSSSQLGLESKTNIGKLHPYGTLNIDEQKITFSKQIQNIRAILQQYKNISGDKDVNKYLSSLRDLAKYNIQVQQLKKCITDCHTTGKKYWESSNTGSKGRILLSRLQEMAEQFAREYSLYSDLEELVSLITDPYSTNEIATVSLCSQYFYVDIKVNKAGEVIGVEVKLTQNTTQVQDPVIDKEVYDLLQAGQFDKFKSHIRSLCRLDKLYQTHQADLQTSLKNLENNLIQIGKTTPDAELKASHATAGYGMISKSCKGLRLDYYIPPFEMLDGTPKKKYGASLSLEEGGLLVTLPSTTQMFPSSPPVDNDQAKLWIDSLLASDSQTTVNARFVARLKPKVPFTFSVLRQILTLTSPDSMDYQEFPDPESHPALLSFIIGNIPETGTIESNLNVMGSNHHYLYSGQLAGGILVGRLPFTHPQQLLPILQLVRQQVIFNELVQSCFNPSNPLSTSQSGNSESFLVEIVTEAPTTICATFLHPTTHNLTCTEIKIALGGVLDVKIHTHKTLNSNNPADPPPCPPALATKILSTCHSIPLTLHYMLKK